MEARNVKINKLPSFSEFYDNEAQEMMIDIKHEISQLNSKLPQNIVNELLQVIENNEYDIIEERYTNYISYRCDVLRDNLREI